MKFKFKPSIGNISALAVIVLAILGLIFGAVSNSSGAAASAAGTYKVDGIGMVIAFSVIAMVCAAAAFVADCMFDGKLFSIIANVLMLAAAGFLLGCFAVMVNARGQLMGDVWFSEQQTGNADAVSAMNMAVVSWVFYILSIVACGVALFGGFCKKAKADESEADKPEESALSQEGIEN